MRLSHVFVIAAAAVALSGCAIGAGLGAPGGGNAKQVIDNLNAFNEAVKAGPCNGWGNLDWNPPLPPTGGLHALCQFGNPNIARGAPGVTGPLNNTDGTVSSPSVVTVHADPPK